MYFAIENIFFDCRIAFLRFLRILNQDRTSLLRQFTDLNID